MRSCYGLCGFDRAGRHGSGRPLGGTHSVLSPRRRLPDHEQPRETVSGLGMAATGRGRGDRRSPSTALALRAEARASTGPADRKAPWGCLNPGLPACSLNSARMGGRTRFSSGKPKESPSAGITRSPITTFWNDLTQNWALKHGFLHACEHRPKVSSLAAATPACNGRCNIRSTVRRAPISSTTIGRPSASPPDHPLQSSRSLTESFAGGTCRKSIGPSPIGWCE